MRSPLTIAAVLVSSVVVTSASPAFAADKAPRKTKATKVAKADPLPPLPTPAVSASPATALPAPEAAPATPITSNVAAPIEADKPTTTQFRQTGFVMSFGTGISYLGGDIVKNLALSGALATFSFKLGVFVSPHVGIMSGIEGAYGSLFDGCANDCKAYAFRVPLYVEYAQSRRRGVHLDAGVKLVNAFGAFTDTENKPNAPIETFTMSSPIDYSLGLGYRFAPSVQERVSGASFDVRLGVDFGQFAKVDYDGGGRSVGGTINDSSRAMHYTAGLELNYHFWY